MLNYSDNFKNRICDHFKYSRKTEGEALSCFETIKTAIEQLAESEKFVSNLNGKIKLQESESLYLFRTDPSIKNLKYINDFRAQNKELDKLISKGSDLKILMNEVESKISD